MTDQKQLLEDMYVFLDIVAKDFDITPKSCHEHGDSDDGDDEFDPSDCDLADPPSEKEEIEEKRLLLRERIRKELIA